jgi:hypothetical protein
MSPAVSLAINETFANFTRCLLGTLEEAGEESRYRTIGRLETISIRQYEVLRNENYNTPDLHDVHGTYCNSF